MAGLRATLRAMRPEVDWRGLSHVVGLLKRWAEPSRDRSTAIRPIEEVHAAGARELDRLTAAGLPAGLDDRLACRDMLIVLVLVLSAAPVRIGNLAATTPPRGAYAPRAGRPRHGAAARHAD